MSSRVLIPVAIIVLIVAFVLFKVPKAAAGTMAKTYLGSNAVPGIRNNNPLNIRRSGNTWKGKIPHERSTDKNFEQFQSWVYGVRAGIINMRTHYNRGKNTIRTLVGVWAPPEDNNDTPAYVKHVVSKTGISADSPFVWDKETVRKLVQAMAQMEVAADLVTDDDFNAAWALVY